MEPRWLHLTPINDTPTMPHQPTRGCWCRPQFAMDVRATHAREDVRVLLHRGAVNDDDLIGLRARKAEFTHVP